jgi:hypothetical protein
MVWLLIASWLLPGQEVPHRYIANLHSEADCLQEIAKLRQEIEVQYHGEVSVSAECVQRHDAD